MYGAINVCGFGLDNPFKNIVSRDHIHFLPDPTEYIVDENQIIAPMQGERATDRFALVLLVQIL